MSGKGSTPRPIPDRDAYERNWDAIFGPDLKCTREDGLRAFAGVERKQKQPEPRKDAEPDQQ